jgi:hypothetical protein
MYIKDGTEFTLSGCSSGSAGLRRKTSPAELEYCRGRLDQAARLLLFAKLGFWQDFLMQIEYPRVPDLRAAPTQNLM